MKLEKREPTPLAPGTLVVCIYRMPSPIQPWIHEIYIGVIEEPGDNPAAWNGTNSERHYCTLCQVARVNYGSFMQHDHLYALIPITPEQAGLSYRDKIGEFLGLDALACYDKSSCQLDKPEEERR